MPRGKVGAGAESELQTLFRNEAHPLTAPASPGLASADLASRQVPGTGPRGGERVGAMHRLELGLFLGTGLSVSASISVSSLNVSLTLNFCFFVHLSLFLFYSQYLPLFISVPLPVCLTLNLPLPCLPASVSAMGLPTCQPFCPGT